MLSKYYWGLPNIGTAIQPRIKKKTKRQPEKNVSKRFYFTQRKRANMVQKYVTCRHSNPEKLKLANIIKNCVDLQ